MSLASSRNSSSTIHETKSHEKFSSKFYSTLKLSSPLSTNSTCVLKLDFSHPEPLPALLKAQTSTIKIHSVFPILPLSLSLSLPPHVLLHETLQMHSQFFTHQIKNFRSIKPNEVKALFFYDKPRKPRRIKVKF